jgi:hypothetical protein
MKKIIIQIGESIHVRIIYLRKLARFLVKGKDIPVTGRGGP